MYRSKVKLDFEEYKEALRDIYPSEDMVNIIAEFFKNKWVRTRRVGVKALIEDQYKNGLISREEAKIKLINSGYRTWIVEDLLDLWDYEKRKGKEFTEYQLCRIARENIWDLEKVMKRIMNKGWGKDETIAWLKLYLPKERWKEIENTAKKVAG